ncbi:MAG: hypothetical protein PHE55_20680 [Methylococcaceae bacterium]|nr:hypothetical protein [Methylococcaceae bacterium]
MAGELIGLLPAPELLPGNAKNPIFRKGLTDLRHWHQRDLPVGISARGDPIRRWLIRNLTEEFVYAFSTLPSVALVGDLTRIGWPDMTDRSLRNVLTDTLFSEIVETVQTRRKNENLAKTITHQAISKASAQATLNCNEKIRFEAATQQGDAAIFAEIERLASALGDDYSRSRLLASLKATRDELGYQQDDDMGN